LPVFGRGSLAEVSAISASWLSGLAIGSDGIAVNARHQDALRRTLEALDRTQKVMAAGASLEVETVPLRMTCRSCGEYNCVLSELSFNCPTCGEAVLVTGGRELEVEYLELD
jgi:Zn finger protein HypA/HybF involved in hydrogenase expression